MNKFLKELRFKTNLARSYALMDINRRSVKEIFNMKTKVQEAYLKADREEKPTVVLRTQLETLKWVLNDTSI